MGWKNFPAATMSQLFPRLLCSPAFCQLFQLLYVAAMGSSCYGGANGAAQLRGGMPHVRAGKIWNYFQNLEGRQMEKNDKSTDWKKLTFQLEGS